MTIIESANYTLELLAIGCVFLSTWWLPTTCCVFPAIWSAIGLAIGSRIIGADDCKMLQLEDRQNRL